MKDQEQINDHVTHTALLTSGHIKLFFTILSSYSSIHSYIHPPMVEWTPQGDSTSG